MSDSSASDGSADGPSRGRRRIVAATAAAFLLAVARYLPVLDEPFDWSTASVCAVNYTAAFERVFDRLGYATAAGIPYFYAAPASGRPVIGAPDVRHPVLFRGFVHAAAGVFGRDERGLRWPPLLFSAMAAALLVIVVRPMTGALAALAGTLFTLATPMGWTYGRLPNFEPYVAFVLLLGLYLHRLRRAGSSAGYWPVYAVFLVGTQTTYPAYFLAPALWAYELLLPRNERRLARTLWLLPIGVVGFAANVGYVAGALDRGFWDVVREIVGAAESAPATAAGGGRGVLHAWFRGLAHAWTGFGAAGAAAVAGAAVLGVRRASAEGRAFVAALWTPVVLHAGLFPFHASVHEFWWYYALAGVGYAAAVVLRAIAGAGSAARAGIAAGVAALAIAVAAHGTQTERAARAGAPELAPRAVGGDVAQFAGASDALTTNFPLREAEFYVAAFPWRVVGPPESAEATAAALPSLQRSGRSIVRRCVLLLAADGEPAPWRGPGRAEYFDAAAFAARAPALSTLIGARAVVVVTIE